MTWLLLVAIILLIFGASRLPQAGRSLGQAFRAFREEFSKRSE
jgi:TatA/E family protein of Tat protein translocase